MRTPGKKKKSKQAVKVPPPPLRAPALCAAMLVFARVNYALPNRKTRLKNQIMRMTRQRLLPRCDLFWHSAAASAERSSMMPMELKG